MEEKAKTVGTRIKLMRVGRHLPQNEVALRIGISQAHLSNIESGRNTVTLELLFKLSEVMDCKVRDFFIDIDGEEPVKQDSFTLQELTAALMLIKK